MDHGLDIERRTRADLLRLAGELDLPLLATNDLHYTSPGDAEAHEVLLCVQTGKTLADPSRFRFDGTRLLPQERRRRCGRCGPSCREACDNTLVIAERCDVELRRGPRPDAAVPGPGRGDRGVAGCVKEVERGLARRFPGGVPDAHREQAEYEVGVICQMGFPGYFLVVADLVPVRARRTASGSAPAAARRPAP